MTVALLCMIAAYGAAPRVPVWQPAPVLAWVPLLVMPVAAILLVAGLTSPNPTLVGGERFLDGAPGSPAVGILSITRHRSEAHTSALQSLIRISYAVFLLKKNTIHYETSSHHL